MARQIIKTSSIQLIRGLRPYWWYFKLIFYHEISNIITYNHAKDSFQILLKIGCKNWRNDGHVTMNRKACTFLQVWHTYIHIHAHTCIIRRYLINKSCISSSYYHKKANQTRLTSWDRNYFPKIVYYTYSLQKL